MKAYFRQFTRDKSGATAPVFVLLLSSLVGVLGIALESGYWFKNKADLQMTADMAAFAGTIELADYSNQTAISAATLDAIANGFDYNLGSISVTSPASSGAYSGQQSVEVNITQKGSQFFSTLFGDNRITYNVRAVASLVQTNDACVLALNTSTSGAIGITGSVAANLPNCSLASNSSSGSAIDLGGSSSVTAECLTTVGGIVGADDHATLDCVGGKPGSRAYEDPFADIVVPNIADYPLCKNPVKTGKWDYDMTSGRYCNNMTIKGTYSLDAGTYVFDGINVNFIGNVATLIGSQVSIFLMNGATLNGLNGGASIIIDAPTSGDYKGIALFSDPDTQPSGTTVKLNGGSSTSIEGLIYFPEQHVEFGGNTDLASACSMLVADTVDMKGNADFDMTKCEDTFGLDVPTLTSILVVE